MDLEDDQFAKRKGEIYSRRSLSINELHLVENVNLIESRKYQNAYDSLANLLTGLKKETLRSEALLYLSEAAFKLGKLDESLDNALLAKEINSTEEKWIPPFAAYFAARVHQKKNDKINLQKMIDDIEDYSDYDYQNKLKNLLNAITN
jgi:hypothetical protein